MRKEAVSQEKSKSRERLSPPRSPYYDELAVKAAQSSVGDGKPASRPPDTALPDPSCPHKNRGDDAAHKTHLLGTLHGPVDRATDAPTVFSGGKEESISKHGDPNREERKEEGMMALPGAQFKKLGTQ